MKEKTKYCLLATLAGIGAIIASVGVSFVHYFPVIFKDVLKEQMRLVEGTSGYDNWRHPPADIYMDFYVWNLNNAEEVANGAKPNVTERGPYTYRETRKKDFIEPNDDGTISYVQPESFIFDPVHSVGDPKEDTFTTINMPLLTLIDQLQYMPELYEILADMILDIVGRRIYSTHTVHDFIWGYFSPLLFVAKLIEPSLVPKYHFGIFEGRNNSNDGVYTVFDGVKDYTKTNSLFSWKRMESLPYWTTNYANMLNGTDGTYFGQFLSNDALLYIFVSDICRSVYTTYDYDTTTHGIPTWHFTPPEKMFENATANPDNAAFCTPDTEHCVPGGLLNISLCQFGAPVYFSCPHFLNADKEVIDNVTGVHPDPALHQTFLDVEPMTGAPLNVSKRSQINTHLRSYPLDALFNSVSESYLPLVWLQERGVATRAATDQVYKQVLLPQKIGKYAPWVALGLGLFILILGLVCVGCRLRKKRDTGLSIQSVQADSEETRPLI